MVRSPVVTEAVRTLVNSNHVFSRWNNFGTAVDHLRVALLQLYARDGRAPTPAILAGSVGLSETETWTLLKELKERDLVILDGERIVGAYPFTDKDTGHLMSFGAQVVNAMCAVDALGIGAMTSRDITIDSRCHYCGEPVRVTTKGKGLAVADVTPPTAVMWLSVQYEGACAASSLCAVTAFFCSDQHLAAWRREEERSGPGFRLSIEEGLEAGRALFGKILAGSGMSEQISADPPQKGERTSNLPAARINRNKGGYDLVVVGAGSAGFSAAITAAKQGAQVGLIGHGVIGGTCTNVGCVPSKTLIRAAETLHNARTASRFASITAKAHATDWQATVSQKDSLVAKLRQNKYIDLLPAYNGIHYRAGSASLVESGITVDGADIAADRIIIATGARPTIPSIAGIEKVPYLTSTSALDLQKLPKSLLVVGGGYIGAELAQMFARAGVKVTLVCRSHLLPSAEPEIGTALASYLSDEGVTVIDGITYQAIRRSKVGISLTITQGGQDAMIDAEQVLIAAGRTPNTGGLGLAEHGIEVSANGSIVIDDRMRTTRAGVYAAGDVTGRDQFVYMAAYGAKLAAKNALNGDSLLYDNSAMPAVVFTDPQVASVGLTEAVARANGHAVRTSTIDLEQVPRALVARDTRGLIKLVADTQTGHLLGAHILAPEGADSIQTAAIAIRQRLKVSELAEAIFPYLTTVEGLKLAALSFEKDVTKLSCCAG